MKDTFWIIGYKGWFIHGCRNLATKREEISIQGPDYRTVPVKSLHAAKCRIARETR